VKEHFVFLFCLSQLNMAKKSESVLEGFIEGPLKFQPTYKFDVGTHTYDTRWRIEICFSSWVFLFPWPLIQTWLSFLVQKRGNLHGQIASCGVCAGQALPCRPIILPCRGVWPHGWAAPPEFLSTSIAVTWASLLAITSQCPPSLLCM